MMEHRTITLNDGVFMELLDDLDVSVAQFSWNIGMTPDHVSKIRQGQRGVSARFIAGAFDAYDIPFPHEIYAVGTAH